MLSCAQAEAAAAVANLAYACAARRYHTTSSRAYTTSNLATDRTNSAPSTLAPIRRARASRAACSSAPTPLVLVVGLGGVGSHAAHLLVRAGVSRLRLVDFDQVTLSSLNRHATATRADVGTSKAHALRDALIRINPEAEIEAIVEVFNATSVERVLSAAPELVIDAIDDLDTKALLLRSCFLRKLRVLCALGAGGKASATQLCVARLAEVKADPIARSLRMLLHEATLAEPTLDTRCWWEALDQEIVGVYSWEEQSASLLPVPDSVDSAAELGTQPNFRVRVLPVLPPVPAAFGAELAARALLMLGPAPGHRHPLPDPQHPVAYSYVTKMFLAFRKRYGVDIDAVPQSADSSLPLTREEAEWIIARVFRCGCAITGVRIHDSTRPRFTLALFDERRPPVFGNVLFATVGAAEVHEQRGLDGMEARLRGRIAFLLDESVQQRRDLRCSMWEAVRSSESKWEIAPESKESGAA